MSDGTLLEAKDLVLTRRGCEVVHGASFRLQTGERRELTAPSGGGKTTLLMGLAYLLPHGGDLWLEGRPPATWGAAAWRCRAIFCPQQPVVLPGSVGENLLAAFGLKQHAGAQPPAAEEQLEELDGLGLGRIGLDQAADQLSGGQQARLAILRALLARPRVLLLDEPDAMLDAAASARLDRRLDAFRTAGGAVIQASHRPRDLDSAWRLERGRLTTPAVAAEGEAGA